MLDHMTRSSHVTSTRHVITVVTWLVQGTWHQQHQAITWFTQLFSWAWVITMSTVGAMSTVAISPGSHHMVVWFTWSLKSRDIAHHSNHTITWSHDSSTGPSTYWSRHVVPNKWSSQLFESNDDSISLGARDLATYLPLGQWLRHCPRLTSSQQTSPFSLLYLPFVGRRNPGPVAPAVGCGPLGVLARPVLGVFVLVCWWWCWLTRREGCVSGWRGGHERMSGCGDVG